jgi:hypothetical protein
LFPSSVSQRGAKISVFVEISEISAEKKTLGLANNKWSLVDMLMGLMDLAISICVSPVKAHEANHPLSMCVCYVTRWSLEAYPF